MRSGQSAARRKATGAHGTPPELARFVAAHLVSAVGDPWVSPLRVLDPACGDGELLVAFLAEAPARMAHSTQLIGVEQDPATLATAAARLSGCGVCAHQLTEADFLELADIQSRAQGSLFGDEVDQCILREPVDVVIANPPYVRTQVLGSEKSRELAGRFGLTGRVDLYQAFVVAITGVLRPGGLLGLIVPNRFMATKSGTCTRALLSGSYDVLDVFDLGDTKLFDAAVLPAVVIARRRGARKDGSGPAHKARFCKIYEIADDTRAAACPRRASSVLDVLRTREPGVVMVGGRLFRAQSGDLVIGPTPSEPWALMDEREARWAAMVEAGATSQVSDVGTVRVGIKTTADDVFIRDDWASLPEDQRPEQELLRKLLSSSEARRWVPNVARAAPKHVLYPHETRGGARRPVDLALYPRAEAYLKRYRARLEARAYVREAGRQWYELWVPQDPDAWARPKIVFPDISPSPRFSVDTDNCVVDGNCYWLTLHEGREDDLVYLILGVANSGTMAKYHDLRFANRLYAGRRRYLSQYVARYPLPSPDTPAARAVIAAAKMLVQSAPEDAPRGRLERQIDTAVAEAFGVPEPADDYGL